MVPIEDKPEPMCALFVKEANKIPEVLDINSNMVNAKLTIKERDVCD